MPRGSKSPTALSASRYSSEFYADSRAPRSTAPRISPDILDRAHSGTLRAVRVLWLKGRPRRLSRREGRTGTATGGVFGGRVFGRALFLARARRDIGRPLRLPS